MGHGQNYCAEHDQDESTCPYCKEEIITNLQSEVTRLSNIDNMNQQLRSEHKLMKNWMLKIAISELREVDGLRLSQSARLILQDVTIELE